MFFYYFYSLSIGVLYLPSAYVIETYGINRSVTLGMILTTVGLWSNYLSLPTIACIFVGIGMPFIMNTFTKVSASWFGPKGRNISTMILILSYFIPEAIEDISQGTLCDIKIQIAIASTLVTPLTFLMIFKNPDFSPTMSEEERFISGVIPFRSQMKMLRENKSYMMSTIASGFILVASHQLLRILEILYENIHDQMREVSFLKELYVVCVMSGLLTFGMALYSTLPIKFGYKLVLIQFSLIFILQIFVMLVPSNVFLIIIYVFDGLFRGGMMVIFYEMTAELAFPVGESLSLGLLSSIHFLGRFIFNFISSCLVSPLLTDSERIAEQDKYIWFYIMLIVFFIFMTVFALYLSFKNEYSMIRYDTDSLYFEDDEEGEGQEEEEDEVLK